MRKQELGWLTVTKRVSKNTEIMRMLHNAVGRNCLISKDSHLERGS